MTPTPTADTGSSTTALVDELTQPPRLPMSPAHAEDGQSLARGAVGIALWHIERAHHGAPGACDRAHAWVQSALRQPVSNAEQAGLFAGLPAIAFLLHAAEPVIPEYRPVIEEFDAHLLQLAHRRVDKAKARIDRAELPSFAEYDLLHGLTGIGQLLLHIMPGNDAVERILHYLIALTRPLQVDDAAVPGWWVGHDPDPLLPTPGGHTNLGLAHGITGPLALLSVAMRRGTTVDGQHEAIDTICAHLDQWRCESEAGRWWPYWVNRDDHTRGHIKQARPGRPSWCYGTPGVARAQQLAALAIGDSDRRQTTEAALAACLTDVDQLDAITDPGICHGWAGLYHTAARAAADAHTPTLAAQLPHLATLLIERATARRPTETGFLDGAAGIALALSTAAPDDNTATTTRSGWDRCLLIS